MNTTRPLFQPDPGWLFIIGGLVLCVAAVIIPAQRDLFALQQQVDALHEQERFAQARLRRHVEFLAALDEGDRGLHKRLIASQLNLIPADETPVLLASDASAVVTDWIDASIDFEPMYHARTLPETRLSRLATGPERLWILGGGVLCVFIGLLTSAGRAHATAPLISDVATRAPDQLEAALDEPALNAVEDPAQLDLAPAEESTCEIVTNPHRREQDPPRTPLAFAESLFD